MTTHDEVPGSRARWPIASTLGLVALGAAAYYFGYEQLPVLAAVLLLTAVLNVSLYLVGKLRLVFDNALVTAVHGVLIMAALIASVAIGLGLFVWSIDRVPDAVEQLLDSKTVLDGLTNSLAFVFPPLLLSFPIIAAYLIANFVAADKFGARKSRE